MHTAKNVGKLHATSEVFSVYGFYICGLYIAHGCIFYSICFGLNKQYIIFYLSVFETTVMCPMNILAFFLSSIYQVGAFWILGCFNNLI